MIEYVEIRGSDTEIIGIIDVANSIIWRSVYFGVGDFEIYTQATPTIINLLKVGRYVTRTDNDEVGIIENINISTNEQDGTMIAASGRFAKSMLDRRIIYKLSQDDEPRVIPTILSGQVESAVRGLVSDNAVLCKFDKNRNISLLDLDYFKDIPLKIVDTDGKEYDTNGNKVTKQVTYENLLTYTDALLEEYGLAATCKLYDKEFRYGIYNGVDRSVDNKDDNMPIVFSKEYDNLISSEYSYNATTEKNVALIGGEGDGAERIHKVIKGTEKGLQRREIFIDAASVARKYKDENGEEKTYTFTEYWKILETKGKQDIAPLVATEIFNGTLDATNGNYIYGRDFSLGDIVTVQDNNLGIYINVRIREVIEVKDENGYSVEIKYQ